MYYKVLLIIYLSEKEKIFVLGDMKMNILSPLLPSIRFFSHSYSPVTSFHNIALMYALSISPTLSYLESQSKGLEWDTVFIVKVWLPTSLLVLTCYYVVLFSSPNNFIQVKEICNQYCTCFHQ